MHVFAEMQELIQSLAHTTARLARAEREEQLEIQQALTERARAITAISRWIAAQPEAAQGASPYLVGQLAQELENGRQVLVRLALAREAMRNDHIALDRELQVLRGIQGLCARGPVSFSCRG